MTSYILRRLLLIPLTLFFILLINFVIINLAPGEPTTVTEISAQGAAIRQEKFTAAGQQYLQFRERYGLTLPILFNTWPWISDERVLYNLEKGEDKIKIGDQARFVMPHLVKIMNDPTLPWKIRSEAMRNFVRGGTLQATLGANLTPEERKENSWINSSNSFLYDNLPGPEEDPKKIAALTQWYSQNKEKLHYTPDGKEKISIFFFQTRFARYFGRVLTLDFGTLRQDPNKTVISEVTKRFKYSLTLSITPMIITFFLCILFGYWMAMKQGSWVDHGLNLTFLILYAIPIFVAAPFLIEKVALPSTFFPIGGFTSPERVYGDLTSLGKLGDVLRHIALPIAAIMYGTLAAESRLARTAVLEVKRQEYVRTAKAKGLDRSTIAFRYIGRNAAITMVTAIAGSLGVVLGGSLIVEILFEIDGFGKFFYDAVVNRDYNVMMFSAIAGSFLTLMGYLAADISYTLLDPRVRLE